MYINILLFIRHTEYECKNNSQQQFVSHFSIISWGGAAHSQRKFVMPCSMSCPLVIFVWSQKITPSYHILFHYIICFLSTLCCTLESSSTLAKYCEVVQLKLSMAFPTPLHLTSIYLIHICSKNIDYHLPPKPVTPRWSPKRVKQNWKTI